MPRRTALAAGVLAVTTVATGGLVLAAPPDGGSDDEIEMVAESALEKWLISQGASFAVGTVACGVDSLSSKSVYCYSHTGTGIIAVSAPIPSDLGAAWQFTLIAGSLGAEGVPIPTSGPQQPPPPISVVPPPTPTAPPPPSTRTDTTAPPPTFVNPAPPTSVADPNSTFDESLQLVNVDVAPGRYQAEGSDFCYWERLSAPNQDTDSIIANAIVSGPVIADIVATDVAFSSSGCGTWSPYSPPAAPATTFGQGSYVVGSDIVAGTYEASGGPDCYWRRLASFTADFDDLVDIDNMTQPGSVVVEPTDVGFESADCGTWTLVTG